MFTKTELNVLQSALRTWRGPFQKDAELTDSEEGYKKTMLGIADDLAFRFEEILQHYFEMER